MQLKATLLTAAALILLMTGTAEGLSNQACQGVSQHSSPITVTPVYTGNPETLEHIRISWDTNPQGTRGYALHRAEADGETLERYQASYYRSGYEGEITLETADYSPDGRADYWYQIAWIAAGWEGGEDTILACSNIANAPEEERAPATPTPTPTATPVPTSTNMPEPTPTQEDGDDSGDQPIQPSQPTPAPQPTATAVPPPTTTPVPMPTTTPFPAPTATARPAPTPSGDANSDNNGDNEKNGGSKEEDLKVSTTAQPTPKPGPTPTPRPKLEPTQVPLPTIVLSSMPEPVTVILPSELTPTPLPKPKVEPQPTPVQQPQLEPTRPERPSLPFIGEALPRQRTTLVVALAIALLFAGAVFIHLILRRR